MALQDIRQILARAADSNANHGILVYPLGDTMSCQRVPYRELHHLARLNGKVLSNIDGFTKGSIALLHFSNHLDNIIWFWSVLYAECIPVMSTPFISNPEHRDKHLMHLRAILGDPVCLTRNNLLEQFPESPVLRLCTVDTLATSEPGDSGPYLDTGLSCPSDLAMLMLTSGSSGNAKAVRLTHLQVLASVAGKSSTLVLELPSNHAFLNWIGLDHVGSLIEIHLHAMFLEVDQVHVQPPDIVSEPLLFLDIIQRHSVARTFAPNFFLAKLRRILEKRSTEYNFDLGCLHYIVSGGEANVVKTCAVVSQMLNLYGARKNVIVPGFGMTETCAGSIYNLDCPQYDLDCHHEFASLGTCISGIEMRVSLESAEVIQASPGEPGNLEITGPIVFQGYHNNVVVTAEAFTTDGWFRTGDLAIIDSTGRLNLVGRTQDSICINGVKYLPHEIETAIEEAEIPGITPSYSLCFVYRPPDAQTDQSCVVYLPSYTAEDIEARIQALDAIGRILMLCTGARPYVLPLDATRLQKSTLGKLSRTKTRLSLERGEYKTYEEVNNEIVKAYKASIQVPPANGMDH